MLRTILTFGVIAGLIVTANFFVALGIVQLQHHNSLLYGYAQHGLPGHQALP
jgi:hypothetical protein